jgi:hypothetical protein
MVIKNVFVCSTASGRIPLHTAARDRYPSRQSVNPNGHRDCPQGQEGKMPVEIPVGPILETSIVRQTSLKSGDRKPPRRTRVINYMHAVNHYHRDLSRQAGSFENSREMGDRGGGSGESGGRRGERHADHFECGPCLSDVKAQGEIFGEESPVVRLAGSWQRNTLSIMTS